MENLEDEIFGFNFGFEEFYGCFGEKEGNSKIMLG